MLMKLFGKQRLAGLMLAVAMAGDEAVQAGLTWSKGRLAKIK
jgi:hypothetical protein